MQTASAKFLWPALFTKQCYLQEGSAGAAVRAIVQPAAGGPDQPQGCTPLPRWACSGCGCRDGCGVSGEGGAGGWGRLIGAVAGLT